MTFTTASDPSTEHDPRPLLERTLATGATVVAGVQPAQFTEPTPCSEMDVRAMLGHLVGVVDRVTALGAGADPLVVGDATASDDAWADAWGTAGQRAVQAWSSDASLDRAIALPWLQGAGREVLPVYLSELTVHLWDLAVATGQRPAWDDDVLTAALDSTPILPAEDRLALFTQISADLGLDTVAQPFAEAVPVPADAPAIDRLVAWNGRDPQAWA